MHLNVAAGVIFPCFALRLLLGPWPDDFPSEPTANPLKLIGILEAQKWRPGLTIKSSPRPLLRAVVHDYNSTHWYAPRFFQAIKIGGLWRNQGWPRAIVQKYWRR